MAEIGAHPKQPGLSGLRAQSSLCDDRRQQCEDRRDLQLSAADLGAVSARRGHGDLKTLLPSSDLKAASDGRRSGVVFFRKASRPQIDHKMPGGNGSTRFSCEDQQRASECSRCAVPLAAPLSLAAH